MNVDNLYNEVKKLNIYHRTIMYLLLEVYDSECSFNEGSLGKTDLIKIFNLMLNDERSEKK